MLTPETLSDLLTGRVSSLWKEDDWVESIMREQIKGRRILVPGGAGSIGSAFILSLIPYKPAQIVVTDPDENALAHLVREVRNRFFPEEIPELITVSLSLGTTLMEDWLLHQSPFDFVFSFAAKKHVRAERDVWSALAMLEVNVLAHAALFHQCTNSQIFSVSTDKAASPANLMGASKRLMERILFSIPSEKPRSSARFANVLFSAGSLTESFWQRYLHAQVFACPQSVKRFILTRSESARFCLLSGIAPEAGIFVPPLDPERDQILLSDLLVQFMKLNHLTPIYFRQEREALAFSFTRKESDPWPVLWTRNDTPGEKEEETFWGTGESLQNSSFGELKYISPPLSFTSEEIRTILTTIQEWLVTPPEAGVKTVIRKMQEWVPEYQPKEGIASLDYKL
jgi:FlaA1/EpsC-like NDP-sugar epimerase